MAHRIVLTGGGTGGHIYPALAVYGCLKEDPDIEAILYIGARGHLEERLALERKIDFVALTVAGMPRKLSLQMIAWPFKTLKAVASARQVLTTFKPTAVLGTGGYAAAPPLAAALLSGIPYAIHEPDAHPGLVNRLFAHNARLCSLGMEGAASVLKPDKGRVEVNGNPVGKNFVEPLRRDAAAHALGLKADLPTLLITGGSQGAKAINDAIQKALPALLNATPEIQIVHQVGEKNISEFKNQLEPAFQDHPRYHIRAYFDDLALAYAACDLAICRAGAMTVSELAVMGTPAIFIPYPFAAQDHQTHNARFVETRGAAVVIPQAELASKDLSKVILSFLNDRTKLTAMKESMKSLGKPQAAHNLALQLKELSSQYISQRVPA